MFVNYCASLYDKFHEAWGKYTVLHTLSLAFVYIFIVSSALILLDNYGFLPNIFSVILQKNIFFSIQLVFSFVLLIEIVELIFALAASVALAVRKQLEVMALILLRDAFNDISLLQIPFDLEKNYFIILQILSTALAGIILFIIRGVFIKMHYVQQYPSMERYLCSKKAISFFLLISFIVIGINDVYSMLVLHNKSYFFQKFYTVLIFSDILVLLAGQYFQPSFHIIFRNSGYAVSTLFMRIALGAPHHISALLCIIAACYILLIAWATSRYMPQEETLETSQSLER